MKSLFLKKSFLLLIACIFLSCSNNENNISEDVNQGDKFVFDIEVLSETRELIMESTEPWEELMLGYYKVLKISDNLWYMWYQAWETLKYSDYGCRICFAYSNNGKDWVKKIPNSQAYDNIIIGKNSSLKEGWVEIDIFIDPNDKEYPFRAIYNKKAPIWQNAYMSKSKNGWEWEDEKLILESCHDSQFSVNVLSDGNYLILLRCWSGELTISNRIIGKAVIDANGNLISKPEKILESDREDFPHLYTNSATFFSDNNYLMIPAMFSNDDKILITTGYFNNGAIYLNQTDITEDLYQNETTGWGNVNPGLISTGVEDEYWMYYYRRVGKHDNVTDYTTFYYRIKVKVKSKSN